MSSPGDKKKTTTPEEIWQAFTECVAQLTSSRNAFSSEKKFNTNSLQRFYKQQAPLIEKLNTLLEQYVDSGDKKYTKEIKKLKIKISKCRKSFYELIIKNLFKRLKTQTITEENFQTLGLLEEVIENDIHNEKVIIQLVEDASSITLSATHFHQQLINTYYQKAEAHWTSYSTLKTKEASSWAIQFAERAISLLNEDQHDPDFSKEKLFNTSILLYKIHLELENPGEQQKYSQIITEQLKAKSTIVWEMTIKHYCQKMDFDTAKEYLGKLYSPRADKTRLETLAINAFHVYFLTVQCRSFRKDNPVDENTAPIFTKWIEKAFQTTAETNKVIKKCNHDDPLTLHYFTLLISNTTYLENLLFEINNRLFLQQRKFLTLLIQSGGVLADAHQIAWELSKNIWRDNEEGYFSLVDAHLRYISSNHGICQIAQLALQRKKLSLLENEKTIKRILDLVNKRLLKLFSDTPPVNDKLLALGRYDFLILGNLVHLQELLNGGPNKKFQRKLAETESAMLDKPETLVQLIYCYGKLAAHIAEHNPYSLQVISFNQRALALIIIFQARSKASPEFHARFKKHDDIELNRKAIEADVHAYSHSNAAASSTNLFHKKTLIPTPKGAFGSDTRSSSIICKITDCVYADEITKAKSHLDSFKKSALNFPEDERTFSLLTQVYQNYIFIGEISLSLKRKIRSFNKHRPLFKTDHLRELFHKKLAEVTSTLEKNFNAVREYSTNNDGDVELLLIPLFTNAHYLAYIFVATQFLESTFETEKLNECEKGLLLIHDVTNYAIQHPDSSDHEAQKKKWESSVRFQSLTNALGFCELRMIQMTKDKILSRIAVNSQKEKSSTQSTLKTKPKPKKKRNKKKKKNPQKPSNNAAKTIPEQPKQQNAEANPTPKTKPKKKRTRSRKKKNPQHPADNVTLTVPEESKKQKTHANPTPKTKPKPKKKRPKNRTKNGHRVKRKGTAFTISFPPTFITQANETMTKATTTPVSPPSAQANKTVTKETQPKTAMTLPPEPRVESGPNTRDKVKPTPDKTKSTKRPTFKRSNSAETIPSSSTGFFWTPYGMLFNPHNAYDSREPLFLDDLKTKYYPKKDDTTEDTLSESTTTSSNGL